ncbi:hypothetical protein PsorP6_002416 [Peronosclerospora sorghi]|uniref:Uncharacterized protein n=1 Tax=Peronosclerospora sorghi TaxID=230839 RepID=A0ACC0WTG5_9STRA|nr:hypothetical protein PsorP6_002416 [Peronosclerospora sorghi]
MENALMHGRQQVEKQDENLELVKAENRKLQEHMDMMDHEHEKHLADHYKSQREAEKRLRQALEQESTRSQDIKEEAEEMRGQIESQAMSAMNQREQQLLDEKARLEDELQYQNSKLDKENSELRANVDGLKDINRSKSIEIGRLMQLQEEVDRVKNQNKKLLQDMATEDATYEETIKSQSGQFQTQYNELVSQVANQINDLTREDEQLRAELDNAAKKVEMYEGKLSLQSVKHDEWRIECKKLQRQMHNITRGNEALKIEFNRRAHDLELKNKENAELHPHIERLKSPDHERMRDVERIQHESIEL